MENRPCEIQLIVTRKYRRLIVFLTLNITSRPRGLEVLYGIPVEHKHETNRAQRGKAAPGAARGGRPVSARSAARRVSIECPMV